MTTPVSIFSIVQQDVERRAAAAAMCKGLLLRLLRFHGDRPPCQESASAVKAIRDGYAKRARRTLSMRDISREVGVKYGVSLEQMRSHERRQKWVLARHEFFFRAYHETEKPIRNLGIFLNRDHSTVAYAIKKHESRLSETP